MVLTNRFANCVFTKWWTVQQQQQQQQQQQKTENHIPSNVLVFGRQGSETNLTKKKLPE